MTIKVEYTKEIHDPMQATEGAAGIDLPTSIGTVLKAGGSMIIPTGITMIIPKGYVCLIKGRSGLAFKHDIEAFNGVIDSDYRGEIMVKLRNHGDKDHHFHRGDRVAQIVLHEIPHVVIQEASHVIDKYSTERGGKGFGSSGK